MGHVLRMRKMVTNPVKRRVTERPRTMDMTVATIGKFMNRPFAYQTAATVRLDEIISSLGAV